MIGLKLHLRISSQIARVYGRSFSSSNVGSLSVPTTWSISCWACRCASGFCSIYRTNAMIAVAVWFLPRKLAFLITRALRESLQYQHRLLLWLDKGDALRHTGDSPLKRVAAAPQKSASSRTEPSSCVFSARNIDVMLSSAAPLAWLLLVNGWKAI